MRQEELSAGKRPEENEDSFDALKYQLTETDKYMRDAILGLILAGRDTSGAASSHMAFLAAFKESFS